MHILLRFVPGCLLIADSFRKSSTRLIPDKRKCLNAFILLLLTGFFLSCKKKNEAPPNKNEVKATVVVSPASTITINATGSKALMGCSFGSGSYVDGTNEANAAVYILYVYGANLSCVTIPGTYSFSCEYRVNVADPNTPIYSNNGANPGSITFTTVNDHSMEGSFTAVCRCNSGGCVFGVDSVVVTGTFKGDHLN
jgi:hypothetical protein